MDQPLLEVLDDMAPPDLFQEACKLGAAKGWYFGHGSRDGDGERFWKMDLDGIGVFDAIWEHTRERCQQLAGSPLQVLRQYANGHTYGLGGQPHVDDFRSGSYTLLYYPMSEWQDGWEGETVFYDEHGEIARSVRPRPNRAILFDSRILHAGRAPSRACPSLRVSVAYKLVTVAVPEPITEAMPDALAESAEHQRTVRVPGDRVDSLVEEHLVKLGATLRLPGFRPGKIPLEVLQKRYGVEARAEALRRLATEAAASVPEGTLVVSVDVVQDLPSSNDVEFRMSVVHLPDLPEPDPSGLTLDHLTASDPDLSAYGLTADDLRAHLKQQMLDHLDATYTFTLPGKLVEREFETISQAAKTQGPVSEEDAAELHHIAERRVRLGIVVSELGRRYQIQGPQMEDLVVDRLLTRAQIRQRPATPDELSDLA